MTLYLNDLTGQADGITLSSTNSIGAGNTVLNDNSQATANSVKFKSWSTAVGSECIEVTSDSGSGVNRFGWTFGGTGEPPQVSAIALEFWFAYNATPPGSIQFAHLRWASAASLTFILTSGNKMILQDNAGNWYTSTATFVPDSTFANAPYRVEVKATAGTSGQTVGIKVAQGISTTLFEAEHLDSARNTGTAPFTSARFGRLNGTAGPTWRFQRPSLRDTNTYIDLATFSTAPSANAGPDQTLNAFDIAGLTAAGSIAASGHTIKSWAWTLTANTSATTPVLSDPTAQSPIYIAPADVSGSTQTWGLVVTDDVGNVSASDPVVISVLPHTLWRQLSSGIEAVQLVPYSALQ